MKTLPNVRKPAGQGELRCNIGDQHRKPICLQDTADARNLQAKRLRDRFALSWPLARQVAELHYGGAA